MPQAPSGTTPGTTDNTEERPARKEDDPMVPQMRHRGILYLTNTEV